MCGWMLPVSPAPWRLGIYSTAGPPQLRLSEMASERASKPEGVGMGVANLANSRSFNPLAASGQPAAVGMNACRRATGPAPPYPRSQTPARLQSEGQKPSSGCPPPPPSSPRNDQERKKAGGLETQPVSSRSRAGQARRAAHPPPHLHPTWAPRRGRTHVSFRSRAGSGIDERDPNPEKRSTPTRAPSPPGGANQRPVTAETSAHRHVPLAQRASEPRPQSRACLVSWGATPRQWPGATGPQPPPALASGANPGCRAAREEGSRARRRRRRRLREMREREATACRRSIACEARTLVVSAAGVRLGRLGHGLRDSETARGAAEQVVGDRMRAPRGSRFVMVESRKN